MLFCPGLPYEESAVADAANGSAVANRVNFIMIMVFLEA